MPLLRFCIRCHTHHSQGKDCPKAAAAWQKGAKLRKLEAQRRAHTKTLAGHRATLMRDAPFCFKCGVLASNAKLELHHIRGVAEGGEIGDLSNLALVCRPCHKKITTQQALRGRGLA